MIGVDYTKAHVRNWKVEDSAGVAEYAIVKAGTLPNEQIKAVTDNNDKPVGITIGGDVLNSTVGVAEFGGYIPVLCADAIASQGLALYLDATDPTKVTDTVPSTTGTYYSIGISKSSTSAADEYVLVFVDIQKLVVA